MENQNIFRCLTRGARFSAKNRAPRNVLKPVVNGTEIKKEPEYLIKSESGTCISRSAAVYPFVPSIELKTEIKSEDEAEDDGEEETTFTLVDGLTVQESRKRKKKSPMTEQKRRKIEKENVNHFRNVQRISVSGPDCPPPVATFDEMAMQYSLSNEIVNNLAICGFKEPTKVQMQAMPVMMKGRSLMACAPTGSGKTAAFLVPILRDLRAPKSEGFRALILCPTRELAKQMQRECLRLNEGIDLKVHTISKTNQAEQKYGPKSNRKYDILITTPNRVCFLLEQNILDLSNIQWLVVDEADKLFEESANSFCDQFQTIYGACVQPQKRVAMFSATYTVTVAKWCRKNLKGCITITVGIRNTAADLVDQELLFVGTEDGKLLALRDIIRRGMQPPVLVFVQSKDRAQQLFQELLYDGVNIDVIHADRTQAERDSVVAGFREGRIWVLVCTELMGRGIDFKGVNLVVNFDFPSSAISYIHRIGRTGRAGRRGKAITFFTKDDTLNLRAIAQVLRDSGCDVPDYMLAIKKRSKQMRKKLMREAPPREDIRTLPNFARDKRQKFKKPANSKPATEKTNFVSLLKPKLKSQPVAKRTNFVSVKRPTGKSVSPVSSKKKSMAKKSFVAVKKRKDKTNK